MREMKTKKLFPIFAFSLFILATTALAFASSGGGEEAHTPLWKDYTWKIINFGVLIIILWKFGKKPIQNALSQRTELIEKTLREAKEAKEAALKAMQEVEQKLKTKDEEVKAIVLMGAAYVVFLPFVGIAMVLHYVGGKAYASVTDAAHATLATMSPAWRPGEAHFAGPEEKKGEQKDEVKPEPQVEECLKALDEEVERRERSER